MNELELIQTSYQWNLSDSEQILSLIGSLLILIAYGLMVARPEKKYTYFSISMVGGALLLAVALIYHNIGFLFLETAWLMINAWGLWKCWQEGNNASH
ncbi:MAG: hypothetical protein HQM07_00225 [Zetaproteobacteria bacterium]|nr:hypothetical protein [Zetaproteobacteria bacterium]